MENEELEYVGFWPRVGASIIDTILIGVITYPILIKIYGPSYWVSEKMIKGTADLFFSWVFPAILVLIFWSIKQATPGKMAISAKIVDAKTGGQPSTAQYIIRYFGYFIAALPIFVGIIWVAFDDKKQGWHDKIARTVVVRPKNRNPRPVSFDE